LTVTSIFCPLLVGQPVWVMEGQSVEGLSRALKSGHNFGVCKVTPGHLQALAGLMKEGTKNWGAEVWVLGGEALKYESLEPGRSPFGYARIVNEYGPTETVVGCCVHEV